MGKDEENWKRRRKREDEREDGELSLTERRQATPDGFNAGAISEDKLEEMMKRAEPMIEQLNSLYRQYFTGVEQRPPIERRKQLDQLMTALDAVYKPTVGMQFKFNVLQANYMSQRTRWDKLAKGLEAGRIKRAR